MLIFVILCDSVILLFVKVTWLPPGNTCWKPGSSSCWNSAVGDDRAAVVQCSWPWSEVHPPVPSCPVHASHLPGSTTEPPRPCQGGKLLLALLPWGLFFLQAVPLLWQDGIPLRSPAPGVGLASFLQPLKRLPLALHDGWGTPSILRALFVEEPILMEG